MLTNNHAVDFQHFSAFKREAQGNLCARVQPHIGSQKTAAQADVGDCQCVSIRVTHVGRDTDVCADFTLCPQSLIPFFTRLWCPAILLRTTLPKEEVLSFETL